MQAVLCGYYGYGNGGDEALLATLLQMLPPNVTPVVLSGNPTHTRNLHGVATCDRQKPLDVIQVLRQSQFFIWGGGSLVQDATSAFSPLYYCGLMLLARWMGLRTIAWSQGIGPLNRPIIQWLAKQAFSGCDRITVRDRGSLEWIQRWGLEATVVPDPVWALAGAVLPELEGMPQPRVAVVLRSHPQLTPERLHCLTEALKLFQQETQTFILLIPFQKSQDWELAHGIADHLPGVSQVIFYEDPRQLKGVFRGVEMAIAMRLHGLIMAASEGCRCFGISYDPKVRRLLEAIDAPGWELEGIPSSPMEIQQQWLTCYQSAQTGESLREALRQKALMLREELAVTSQQ
jgi:polysaccharide pyruvyl transferase CsaB